MRNLLTLAVCGIMTLGLGAAIADEAKKTDGACCASKAKKECADAAKDCSKAEGQACADKAKKECADSKDCSKAEGQACADKAKQECSDSKDCSKAEGQACADKAKKECSDASKDCSKAEGKCCSDKDSECASECAAANADEKVTIKGDGVCGKCALKETEACENVVLVEKDGKTVAYYLEKNEFFKDAHQGLGICTASKEDPVKVKVVGTLVKKDDKHILTPTEKVTKLDD